MSRTYRNSPDPDRIRHPKRATRIASVLLALSIAANASALSGARQSAAPVAPVVNVNTATAAQLAFLPGIGSKTAVAIVAGRPYASVADLDKVKGIGPKKLAGMRPYVVLTGPTTASAKIKVVKPLVPVVPAGKARCGPGTRCAG